MLWQGWLEKHPETVTPPWDDCDTRAAWDQHAAEAYYSYWEQYTYWAAQGWTASSGPRHGEEGQDEGTTGAPDVSVNDHEDEVEEEVHHGTRDDKAQPDAAGGNADCEGQQEGEGEDEPGSGLEELMVEMSFHTTEGEAGGPRGTGEQRGGDSVRHGEPCDGGNDRKRAGGSSTEAEDTGKERERDR